MKLDIEKHRIAYTVLPFLYLVFTVEVTANYLAKYFGLPILGRNMIYSTIMLVVALLLVALSKNRDFLKFKVDNSIYLLFLLPELIYILVFWFGYGGFQALPSDTVLIVTIGVIVGVLPEEIFFRGVFQDFLRPVGKIKALLVLSIMFSFGHIINGTENMVHTFLIGALYFLLREKLNTIWPLILMHIYNNLAIKFINFEAVGGPGRTIVLTYNISMAICIATIFYIEWKTKGRNQESQLEVA